MCQLTITGVLGVESVVGNGPDEIEVRGTATDCTDVCVQITQTNPVDIVTPERTAVVDAGGNWTVTFRVADSDFAPGDFLCGFGNKAIVLAYCCDDATCQTQFNLDALPCGDCPAISQVAADVSDICVDGKREVTIGYIVSPGAGGLAVVQVLSDDGTGTLAESVDTPGTTLTTVLDYEPGPHSASIVVIVPQGCPGEVVNFDVPDCDDDIPCPEIEIEADQSQCDDQGRRTVDIQARVLLASGGAVAASLLHVDGANAPIGPALDTGQDPNGDLLLTGTGVFQAGTSPRFRVVVTEPDDCPGATVEVELPACDDERQPPVIVVDPEPVEGCPWAWLLPFGLVFLIAGVLMTIAGACIVNVPLIIAGGVAAAVAVVALPAWAYLCQDCATMRLLLFTSVGAFDVLAVVGLILAGASQAACASGFLAAALLVATTAFGLAVPYMLLCVDECVELRAVLGVLAAIYAVLLLAALVLFITGVVDVGVILLVIAAILAAVALNLVLLPILVWCNSR